MSGVEVVAEGDDVLNSDRTGAATFVGSEQVIQLPSIKRSTRDLTRLDPRSDGNFSFGGRNWLYNNISLDGSYFNNPFGLDDPAPGGQANAEPVSIYLLFTHYETVSLAVVIVVTLAVGIIIGFTIALNSILISKNEARNLKSENRKLIEEVNNLRNIAIDEGIYELNEGEE